MDRKDFSKLIELNCKKITYRFNCKNYIIFYVKNVIIPIKNKK